MEPAASSNPEHPEVLEEKTPALIADIVLLFQHIYATYGWYLLGVFLASLYLWSRVKPYYEKWRKQREESAYAAQLHKNPDLFRAREEAIVSARLRMQAEHDRLAKLQAEKAREREEQKREDWIARQVGSADPGHRLASKELPKKGEPQSGPSKKGTSSFRPEYNPLMGSGGSGGYRPQKRGCPGGGCGKK